MTTCSDIDIVDIAIIGAGPAGLSAGLYGARAGLKTVIFGDPYAGQLAKADPVENYMTWTVGKEGGSPSGLEIIEAMLGHVESVGGTLVDTEIKQIVKDKGDHFSLIDSLGNSSCAYTVILASGTKHKKAGIKGEDEGYGRGVGYCTICDGPLYAGLPVAITGYGNELVQAALRMASVASELHVVSLRPRIGADPDLIDELETYQNVTLHHNSRPIEITYDKDGVDLYKFHHDGHDCERRVKAVFIEVGVLPSSAIASQIGVELDNSFIKVNRDQSTNVSGFYAAGDITGGIARQAIVSAGDGARAAISAMDYIKRLGVSTTRIKGVQWGGSSVKMKPPSKKINIGQNALIDYINADDGFKSQYNRYKPNFDILDKVKQKLDSIKLITISSHWCPDCRRNVPRMAKISEFFDDWEIVVEDRDGEGIREKYEVRKIPTFILQDIKGNEIGRIIESPKYHNLESDLLKISQGQY